MNTAITKRSLNKSGRDAGAGAFALLVMSVLQEHIDLSVNEAMIALAVLTPIVTLFYRMARDHGLVLPTEVDDEPLPPEAPEERGFLSARGAFKDSYARPEFSEGIQDDRSATITSSSLPNDNLIG